MSSDTRAAYLDEAYEIIKKTTPDFDFKSVAERGLQLGLLSQPEANGVDNGARFPAWLVEGLSERIGPAIMAGPEAAMTVKKLVPATHAEFTEPKRDAYSRLTPRLIGASQPIDAMTHYSGGPSRHNLVNFKSLMLNADGTVGELTAKGAAFLAPLMAEADPVRLPGHCFLGVVAGAVIYAHWILDTLPRLLQMRAAGYDFDRFDSFIFTETNRRYHVEVLELLGIAPEKAYSRNRIGCFVSCDSFEYVSNPRTASASDLSNYALLRQFFFGDFEPKKRPSRRLYISRQRSASRNIFNGKDVEDILAQRGFEAVYAEEHSIVEFARIMADAEYVIGPHGAGFTNIMFCQPGTRVCELYSAHISSDYWRVSQQLGLDYHVFQGLIKDGREATPEVIASMPRAQANGIGILVDTDRLTDYLDNVFLA